MTDLMTGGLTELTEWMTWLNMRKIEEETSIYVLGENAKKTI
jgi:hypothetical protein